MGEDTARAFTVKQIQERLQLGERTVLRLIDRGELRAVKAGRVWRVPVEALQEYLAGGTRAKAETGKEQA